MAKKTKAVIQSDLVDESKLDVILSAIDVKLSELEDKIDLIMKSMLRNDASVFKWAKEVKKEET